LNTHRHTKIICAKVRKKVEKFNKKIIEKKYFFIFLKNKIFKCCKNKKKIIKKKYIYNSRRKPPIHKENKKYKHNINVLIIQLINTFSNFCYKI
jgi:hypothetical protein